MRNMSFSMTTAQFHDRSKTVTRRFGWWFLKPGDVVMGVEKSQGLKKGETVVRLGRIRIVSVRKEPLDAITCVELDLEGLPDTAPREFVALMAHRAKKVPAAPVNRIEYEYLD